jgi:hypothetical protein
MSTAPPAPPPVDDPELDPAPAVADPEALIEEARQRTQRRRRRYALALVAGAAAGLGIYFGLAGGGTSAPPTDALASPPAAAPVAANAANFELWFWRGYFQGGCCGPFPTWRTAAELGISPDEDIHTRSELSGPDENRRATDLLERVLRSLIAGPTPADNELLQERARDMGYPDGFQWADGSGEVVWGAVLPPNTQLLGVTLSNGIATIDIASELAPPSGPLNGYGDVFNLAGGFDYHLRFGMFPEQGIDGLFTVLVLTATQFPFVDGVLFKLDGQPVKAQVFHGQAYEAAKLDPDDTSTYLDFYELVGRPVTSADYEGNRGEDAISRQGPGT